MTLLEDRKNSLRAALLDRSLLESLERLWIGPLSINDIRKIELALRAFLTADELIVSRAFEPWARVEHPNKPAIDYEQPFDDHLLDYEFRDPSLPHQHIELSKEEDDLLTKQYSAFVTEALSQVPKEFTFEGEYAAYLDAWYKGHSIETCYKLAKEMHGWEDFRKPFRPRRFIHAVTLGDALRHAEYIVGSARAGLMIYGTSPIYKFCNEHTFEKWPQYLYRKLDKNYRKILNEIRSPRSRLMLPPITSIVLARTPFRSEIPRTIIELREEFASARREFWDLIDQVMNGETLQDRISAVRILKQSADSIFDIPHSAKRNVLSLGAGLMPAASSEINCELLEMFNELDAPHEERIGVCSVSLARKLGEEMNNVLNIELSRFRMHFSKVELRNLNL